MNNHEEFNNCKTQLEKNYKIKTDGINVRIKSEWFKHKEKSSKFFLNIQESCAI